MFEVGLMVIRLHAAAAKSLQLCPILCDPIGSSPPGSPVPGILQARALEWVAISFSNVWEWKVKVKSLSRAQQSLFLENCPGWFWGPQNWEPVLSSSILKGLTGCALIWMANVPLLFILKETATPLLGDVYDQFLIER